MYKRKLYRKLLEQRAGYIQPGVYDGLSARIAEAEGFKTITGGGFASIGSMLGGPDIGQSNMRDYAEHYGRISAAVDVPVSVDADTGFGDVHNVVQMVRAFEAAGVSSVMISDQSFPNRCGYLPGKTVVPIEEMLAKLKAALAARQDPDLVIVGRTDARGIHGLEEAQHRCQLFMQAGCDMVKLQGVDKLDEIRSTMAVVPGPFSATLSQAAINRHADITDLRALGVSTISLPSVSLFAAARAVRDALHTLQETQTLAAVEPSLIALGDYNEIVGLDRKLAEELGYRDAARDVISAAYQNN